MRVLREERKTRAPSAPHSVRPTWVGTQCALLRARLRAGEAEALEEDHVIDHQQYLRENESRGSN